MVESIILAGLAVKELRLFTPQIKMTDLREVKFTAAQVPSSFEEAEGQQTLRVQNLLVL